MKATLCNNGFQIFWQTDRSLDAMPLGDYVHAPELREMLEAGKALSFAAQITGGTAGRDDGLVAAIDRFSAALKAVQP